MILNRNDLCWCKSGVKYKNCHLEFDKKLSDLKRKGHIVPTRDLIKTKEQIEGIRKSAEVNNGLLDLISENIKEGMTTEQIDKLAYDYTISKSGIPADLNYDGFPKSICISINNEVCHGIPSDDVVLKNGDIVNVDATTILNGYYSDASRMFMIGEVSEEARKLVQVTKECVNKGLEAVKPWAFLGDIGAAIQEHAENNGYSVVREFGGHGVGLDIHEDPFVFHFGKRGTDMVLAPGMVFTIEPMINAGSHEIFIDEDNGWTALTADGSLSAQWEHTVLVTEDGVEVISK
ncbi:methionyl aminopeptidase [Clostridium beijerinckii]|uniref:Methionine aminopeptidase n=1 Tax=Clostridium beijerinckii TaxID=1520 RepID=A0A9Q5GI35_CLOBE|nr:methionyl aminopeptidase [Clostridium beijerinckii]AQS06373.1 methionine aminopeptidase [Clostridium beijerinckii]MBA2885748.1 methionyl aminopeptidase [Clostridium beijerinckii]MBA2900551.1 methionyl aminopeptidase [Clostridium beijerinckii]MBA2910307.1 methionyl aminopeptidase [Clostridium beijerinckii]MBA9014010.1 methionyl aminopeptidase [Clostridium beijerinckii]